MRERKRGRKREISSLTTLPVIENVFPKRPSMFENVVPALSWIIDFCEKSYQTLPGLIRNIFFQSLFSKLDVSLHHLCALNGCSKKNHLFGFSERPI